MDANAKLITSAFGYVELLFNGQVNIRVSNDFDAIHHDVSIPKGLDIDVIVRSDSTNYANVAASVNEVTGNIIAIYVVPLHSSLHERSISWRIVLNTEDPATVCGIICKRSKRQRLGVDTFVPRLRWASNIWTSVEPKPAEFRASCNVINTLVEDQENENR